MRIFKLPIIVLFLCFLSDGTSKIKTREFYMIPVFCFRYVLGGGALCMELLTKQVTILYGTPIFQLPWGVLIYVS